MHRGSLGVALAAAWLLCGCVGSYGSTVLAHPLRSGQVGENAVRLPDEMLDELLLRLPDGTLTREASLTALDGNRACFDLTLRLWKGAGLHSLAEKNLRVTLEVDAGEPVSALRPFSSWKVVEEPQRFVGSGRVCFDTGGRVTQASEELELYVLIGALELGFVWRLAERPPAWSGA